MLRHLMQGTSWIALRAPDEEGGSGAQGLGDPHGDEVLESGPPDAVEPAEPGAEDPTEPLEAESGINAEAAPAERASTEDERQGKKPKTEFDWKDKDRDRLRARVRDESQKREALAAEVQRLTDLNEAIGRNQQPEGDPPARQPTGERTYSQAELQAEAARLAKAEAGQMDFRRKFDNIHKKAVETYGAENVQKSIALISELGGLDANHLTMIYATDNPEKVLYELGSKPEEFQRIMELEFPQRVVELTKMGLKMDKKQAIPSKTPAPVDPIAGNGGSVDNRYSDSASDNDWFKAEEKRAEARYKAKQAEWRK